MTTIVAMLALAALMIFIIAIVFASYFPLRALLVGVVLALLFLMFAFVLLPRDSRLARELWTNIDLNNALTGIPILIFFPPAASFLTGSVIGWIIFAVRTMRRRRRDRRTSGQF